MKTIVALFLILAVNINVFAEGENKSTNKSQSQSISGIVVDSQTNEALAGVAIKINETGETVYSDFNGNFTLSGVSQTCNLSVSYISYENKTIQFMASNVSAASIKLELNNVEN